MTELAGQIATNVHQQTTTTGTGNKTLTTVSGRRTFNAAFGTGGTDTFFYFIRHRSQSEWEFGKAHLSDSTTLVVDTILGSSNSGSAVNFSSGTMDVTNDVPASYLEFLNSLARVRLAADSNVDLSADLAATSGHSIDGVTLAAGDLVLVFGQTDASENGVYVVPSSGAASRHTAFSSFDSHVGLLVSVSEGTTYADTLFQCTADEGGTLATTDIDFEKVPSDTPQFTSIELGHASDTTLARASAGDMNIEGNIVYRAGGTDVPVGDGGTGRSSHTAYAVLCGGTISTGAQQSIAGVGTSGQVLTSNGAAALPTFQDATSEIDSDLRLAFLLIAENAGDRVNMVDGIADPFADETDVDTATSTNETYDATGDFYSSAGFSSDVLTSGMTWTAQNESAGAASNVADDDTGTAWSHANTTASWISVDLGSGNAKQIEKYSVDGMMSRVDQIVHTGSDTGDFSGEETTIDTWDTTSVDDDDTVTEREVTNSTSYRYYRWDFTLTSSTDTDMREMEAFETQSQNMTIVSNSFTADAAPDTGRIHVQVKENEAITVNTDLTAEISRDGGTSWTSATLSAVETLADGTVAYEDNSVDISGQPSGTNMQWRIKTLNTKDIEIHGVVLQWD